MKFAQSRVRRRVTRMLGVVSAVALLMASLPMAGSVVQAAEGPQKDSKAASSTLQSTEGAIQNYAADKALQPGTIVRMADKAQAKVAPAQFGKANEIFGVVVTSSNLPLTITSDDLPNSVYVAISGTYDVMVSTQNGAIKAGDYITISAIDGLGMVATPGEDVTVIGRAAEAFDGKANVLGSVQLKTKDGKTAQKVALGSVALAIDIRQNPQEKSTKANVPEFLEKVGEQIADKQVSPIRIYLSIAITGITVVVALVLLYAGVRNAVTAIGRNPLSKKTIIRTLIEITLTGFIILIIGLFTVYLLLKL